MTFTLLRERGSTMARTLCLLVWALCMHPAHAVLQDEIQVYTDEINEPGENGLEWHLNSTPSGVATPSYPGEMTSLHGFRATAELSHGVTRTVELGLYIPTAFSSKGTFYAPGLKARIKWLPIQPQENSGFFAGVNFELSQVSRRFSDSPWGGEIRNILGWRNDDWLVAVNPILGLALSPGVAHTPTIEWATKVTRRVGPGWSLGFERYNDRGPYNRNLPVVEQNTVNYAVLDLETQHFDLNLGVGRGSNTASDKWTLKAIVGLALGK